MQSSSADAAIEVETSTNETVEVVRKFVMKRRGWVQRDGPHLQVYVHVEGRTRAVEIGRENTVEATIGIGIENNCF